MRLTTKFRPSCVPPAQSKRQRTGAVQNLTDIGPGRVHAKRLGLRWSSTAFRLSAVRFTTRFRPPHVARPQSKRQRTGAVQNLTDIRPACVHAKRLGLRWSSTAFPPSAVRPHDKVSPIVRPTRTVKAPEDWRSPKPDGHRTRPCTREASWTAVVLHRFSFERGETHDKVSPIVRPTRTVKAPEDWRSPKPGGHRTRPCTREAVLDCGGPPPLFV